MGKRDEDKGRSLELSKRKCESNVNYYFYDYLECLVSYLASS